ncbi:MAG: AarF/UbiB family protein [Candidatus Paceibacterota bacterium]
MKKTAKVGIIKRSCEMIIIGSRYFLFYKINKHRKESLGIRIRLACEELGLVFIKLGQILSTRYDLLERKDCEELQKLLDEVPPMSYEVVKSIFIQDFGRSPEELYEEFNPEPIAAASIAQVYKAKLADGKSVAIKVRRPDVDRTIKSDLNIFRKLAKIAEWFSSDLRHINLEKILEQLESWLLAEIDFKHELENLKTVNDYYHKLINKSDGELARALVFPVPYPNLSSANILVMSFIEGISVRQSKSIPKNSEYDVKTSLEKLIRAVLRAWIGQEELFFHGDPHPSNLLILPEGKIALLDLGLLGHFDHKDIQETKDLFLAVYSKNIESSTQIALKMCNASKKLDTPELREDIRIYLERTRFSGLGFWFMGLIHIFVKHRVPMPYQLILFGRCQTILEGVFETVLPGTSALDILGEELERGMRRQVFKNISSTNVLPIIYALSEKFKKSPELVAGLVDKYFDDPLQAVRDLREAVR